MDSEITYRLVLSERRTTSIEINRNGEVVVRCPEKMPIERIEALVRENKRWIETHLARKPEPTTVRKLTRCELDSLKKQAGVVFDACAAFYADKMGVSYNRLTVRFQRTKWGSCSSKGNLNFNGLLLLAPKSVLAYIVVHELAHRKHLNHSAYFWKEVESVMPEYREQERWLKENGYLLMERLPD